MTLEKNSKQVTKQDKELGKKVRTARRASGLSQHELGELLGVTYQQIQKYEKGTNRISVSRLLDIAKTLNRSVSYFLNEDSVVEAPFIDRSSAMLLKYFREIEDEKLKNQLISLAKSLAK